MDLQSVTKQYFHIPGQSDQMRHKLNKLVKCGFETLEDVFPKRIFQIDISAFRSRIGAEILNRGSFQWKQAFLAI